MAEQFVTAEQLKAVVESISRELLSIKEELHVNTARRETIIGTLDRNAIIKKEEFVGHLDDFSTWAEAFNQCIKEPSILKRVALAKEYNAKGLFKLTADELLFLSQIENAGGTSPEVIAEICTLPYSVKFLQKISKYLPKKDVQ